MTKQEKLFKENGGYKFKFTVIMAVYNVEDYIDEAIQSITCQTIGFEDNIQLILSDDGSPDGSGAICDKYKEMYPNNVVVIHKENGGPGSARNAALPYIEGRYVNFLDPDDTISSETFKNVYKFFVKNDHKTSYVAIPMYFFGDMSGEHHLNNKFERGSRVIDLLKEHNALQYSEASAFIKHDVAKAQCFDTELVVAEDAQQIIRILIDNPTLGVCTRGRYNYRKRGNSLVSTGTKKKGWYLDYLKRFSLPSFEYAKERLGYIPKFVQNTVMGDLRWRFAEEALPPVLTPEETEEYKELIYRISDMIDSDIIAQQTRMMVETKAHLIKRKQSDFRVKLENDISYGKGSIDWTASQNMLQICFVDHIGDSIEITARLSLFPEDKPLFEGSYIALGKHRFKGQVTDELQRRASIGEAVAYWKVIKYTLPKKLVLRHKSITFFNIIDGITIKSRGLTPGIGLTCTNRILGAYSYRRGIMTRLSKNKLKIYRSNPVFAFGRELLFLFNLLFSRELGAKKAFMARGYNLAYKMFHRKHLWLITDRLNKAGDNGEAFLDHLVKTGFDKADYIFAISDCEDYRRLRKIYGDRVVLFGTNSYKLKFLAVDKIISSHAENYILDPFEGYSEPYRDLIKSKDFIFLQHGVIKDDLSDWLNRFNKNIRAFITSAPAEWDSIAHGNYLYDEERVWLTGLCRFDRLYNEDKKYITLMPTWRKYLMGRIDKSTGTWCEGLGFKESLYFKFFNCLINDKRVLETAKKHGYTLCFMPHPNTITSIKSFDKNDEVKFFTINDSYRDVFANSSLILTDYSSAIFDFIYLRKPIFYTQFDREEFITGDHAYVPGYFEYERDGFGEVVYDYESTVNLLCEYMENGCKLKDFYRERIDKFFAFNDKNNCQRILEKILELE
ncbi:MAG: CDP-glycerol glycerophosphotransferase family protein [Clostridia bacterium]|nr:CDP-glycerol glycerophosphotransferase family protein [Clostridia bacterium]